MTRPDSVEAESALGARIRSLRLLGNVTQSGLASRAGVSLQALRSLENGTGTSLRTLILVIQALDMQEWLGALAPKAGTMASSAIVRGMLRQRAHPDRDLSLQSGQQ